MNGQTLGQRAAAIMMERRPCTVILRDGGRVQCDRITKTSTAVVAANSGEVEVAVGGQQRTIFLDDIQEIQ